MVHPSCYDVLLRESKQVFNELYENNLYAKAIKEIAAHAKKDVPMPQLVEGDAPNVINEAQAYLMP
jgi:hypothetical protein